MPTLIVERYTPTPDPALHAATPEEGEAFIQKGDGLPFKPLGTWVSVPGEDDWPKWCRSEKFGLQNLRFRHTFELDMSRVMLIDTPLALGALSAKYARPLLPDMPSRLTTLNWPALMRIADGIVIAPYLWECRYEHLWYYGWDCASGCIWNTQAFTRFISTAETT